MSLENSRNSRRSIEIAVENPSQNDMDIVIDDDNQQPTKSEPSSKYDKLNEYMDKLEKAFPNWDLYMLFEAFLFFMTFVFLAAENDDTDTRSFEHSYLYQVNSVFLVDFLFRLLSIEIESVKREYWNKALHCIIPLIMWLLAAFYKFDNVFGSNPVQVLNALLFAILNFAVLIMIISQFVSFEKLKQKFNDHMEKRKQRREQKKRENSQPGNPENNDIELGN